MVMQQPKQRSALRIRLGRACYGTKRKFLWLRMNRHFCHSYSCDLLPYQYASHRTLLKRQLKQVDMWMQENKIVNLRIAAEQVNGVLLYPDEIFSYWKLIGKPTVRKGYLPGMVLRSGKLEAGIGGGLCQLSNLIFWMTLHTPLTVLERHRHGYDVFPDSDRTQPFGSGATCFYPHGDLMIRNDTKDVYQLVVTVGEEYLEGEWRVSQPPEHRYEIVERNHAMRAAYWGGYTRHNELYQKKYDRNGNCTEERLAVKNDAIMMYAPFLEGKGNHGEL